MAFSVDDIALLVHHIIVLDEAFTDTKVILLYLLLCALNRVGNHLMLDHLTLLEAHLIHQACQSVGTEHTHQVVLHTHEEHTATWVTLTSCTTTQLTVHTATLVALGTKDSQTASLFHFWRKFNIRTTTRHVRSDSYHTLATCLGYDVRLALVQLGIQYVVRDFAQVQHSAQQFTDFHRSSTNQHWATCFNQLRNLINHGVVFLALGAIDTVVHIFASDRAIGRNNHHIQFVDIPELACLCFRSTRHT